MCHCSVPPVAPFGATSRLRYRDCLALLESARWPSATLSAATHLVGVAQFQHHVHARSEHHGTIHKPLTFTQTAQGLAVLLVNCTVPLVCNSITYRQYWS